MDVILEGPGLSIEDVVGVARQGAPVRLGLGVRERMAPSRAVVERAVAEGATVYGVTTGFGLLANERIPAEEALSLQERLLRSHACGTGEPLADEVVRAMLLLRARSLAMGMSGVRFELVERMVEMLNAGIVAVVPSKGSVGASGDLAPLAHLSLALLGEGQARVDGETIAAAEALARKGLKPFVLGAKEGLSLLNGTDGMLAMLCLALADTANVLRCADVTCAMSLEALLATDRPLDPRVQALRPHPGQRDSASNIRLLVGESPLVAGHRESTHALQDAYCLRCAPQVHGAVRDAYAFARGIAERELESAVDNPVVFADTKEVISTGNFHGAPLALACDVLAIALTDLASISERRMDRMLDPALSSGLPPFLTPKPGLDSGMMLVQYTAAAIVAECKVLAHPASVDSIPTSGNQEDHVSMGFYAARKLREVVSNVGVVLGLEALCAAQGLDFRLPVSPGPGTAAAHACLRRRVAFLGEDRYMAPDVAAARCVVEDGSLVAAVVEAVGPLA